MSAKLPEGDCGGLFSVIEQKKKLRDLWKKWRDSANRHNFAISQRGDPHAKLRLHLEAVEPVRNSPHNGNLKRIVLEQQAMVP